MRARRDSSWRRFSIRLRMAVEVETNENGEREEEVEEEQDLTEQLLPTEAGRTATVAGEYGMVAKGYLYTICCTMYGTISVDQLRKCLHFN